GGAADVVDDELVSRPLQVGRHAGTHRAKPDETDFHVNSPELNPSPANVGEGAERSEAGERVGRPKDPHPPSAARWAPPSPAMPAMRERGVMPYRFSNTSLAICAAVIAAGQPA